ncbi:hypothetical protein ACFLRN_09515 [Thermoproteota archaeon]
MISCNIEILAKNVPERLSDPILESKTSDIFFLFLDDKFTATVRTKLVVIWERLMIAT